ncbi:MAG: hypothetical protein J6U54_18025 [Clostridiales bacterium]|nr:hypothetical protein [Clostridiales bacterium]
MNKFAVAALSFAAGGLAGFLVGYFITIEKEEGEREVVTAADLKAKEKEDVESKKPEVEKPENVVEISSNEAPTDEDEDDPYSKLVSSGPARIARPGQNGVNYSKVREIVVKNGYTDPEDIEAVINDPDNEETYEERLEREAIEDSEAMAEYRRKNKDKIVPIPHDEWDTDFPEIVFDHADLHYFTEDGVLTDDDGNKIMEYEYMGPKPRQMGWMSNSENVIYIRNNPKETDFQVWKHNCTFEDWWA